MNIHTLPTSKFNAANLIGAPHPKAVDNLTKKISALRAWEPALRNPVELLAATNDIDATLEDMARRDTALAAMTNHGTKAVQLLETQREREVMNHADHYLTHALERSDELVETLNEHAPKLDWAHPLNRDIAVNVKAGDSLHEVVEATRGYLQLVRTVANFLPRTEGNVNSAAAAKHLQLAGVQPQPVKKNRWGHGQIAIPDGDGDEARRQMNEINQLAAANKWDELIVMVARGDYPIASIGIPTSTCEYLERVEVANNTHRTAVTV